MRGLWALIKKNAGELFDNGKFVGFHKNLVDIHKWKLDYILSSKIVKKEKNTAKLSSSSIIFK